MLEVSDDEDWLTHDNTEDDDDGARWVWSIWVWFAFNFVHVLFSNAIVGETSLDRLANALGGKSILPHIISNIPAMMQSGEEEG